MSKTILTKSSERRELFGGTDFYEVSKERLGTIKKIKMDIDEKGDQAKSLLEEYEAILSTFRLGLANEFDGDQFDENILLPLILEVLGPDLDNIVDPGSPMDTYKEFTQSIITRRKFFNKKSRSKKRSKRVQRKGPTIAEKAEKVLIDARGGLLLGDLLSEMKKNDSDLTSGVLSTSLHRKMQGKSDDKFYQDDNGKWHARSIQVGEEPSKESNADDPSEEVQEETEKQVSVISEH